MNKEVFKPVKRFITDRSAEGQVKKLEFSSRFGRVMMTSAGIVNCTDALAQQSFETNQDMLPVVLLAYSLCIYIFLQAETAKEIARLRGNRR